MSQNQYLDTYYVLVHNETKTEIVELWTLKATSVGAAKTIARGQFDGNPDRLVVRRYKPRHLVASPSDLQRIRRKNAREVVAPQYRRR